MRKATIHYWGGYRRGGIKRSRCGRVGVRLAEVGEVCNCKRCMVVLGAKDRRDS